MNVSIPIPAPVVKWILHVVIGKMMSRN